MDRDLRARQLIRQFCKDDFQAWFILDHIPAATTEAKKRPGKKKTFQTLKLDDLIRDIWKQKTDMTVDEVMGQLADRNAACPYPSGWSSSEQLSAKRSRIYRARK